MSFDVSFSAGVPVKLDQLSELCLLNSTNIDGKFHQVKRKDTLFTPICADDTSPLANVF